MLTTNVTKTLDIPGEAGQTITFRMLGYLELELASTTRLSKVMADIKGMTDLTSLLPKPDNGKMPEPVDRLLSFDRRTLINAGVTAWTYPVPVSVTALDTLDDVTAEWLAREILDYSKPSADDIKKGSSRATVS